MLNLRYAPDCVSGSGKPSALTAFNRTLRRIPVDEILSLHRDGHVRGATDKATDKRISTVAMMPVCTPVPPVISGRAAGYAGLAPPAFALSERTSCHLAASGTYPFSSRPVRPTDFSTSWGAYLRNRPRAAKASGSPARVRRSGYECRLNLSRRLAPKRALRLQSIVSRPGNGVNSHTPARVIATPRA